MNRRTRINNNEMLMRMVNSIRGVTPVEEDDILNQANVELFINEIKNNKDVVLRRDIEISDIRKILNQTQADKDILQDRLSKTKTSLTLSENKVDEMDSALEEMKSKVKHSYIEAEVKHKVKLHKEEEEFYKKKYNRLDVEYSALLGELNKIALERSSSDLKEMAVEFARHASPKIIIPDVEQKEA